MDLLTIFLLVAGLFGLTLRQGYRRRRGVWTRRSWVRFGLLLALSLVGCAVAVAMADGVDHGVYEGMSPLARRLYFYTLMALTLGGPLAAVGLVVWLASGRPERQMA